MLNSRYFLGDITMMEQDHRACNGPVRIAPIDDKPSVDLADIIKNAKNQKAEQSRIGRSGDVGRPIARIDIADHNQSCWADVVPKFYKICADENGRAPTRKSLRVTRGGLIREREFV